MTKKKKLIIAAVVVLVGAGALYVKANQEPSEPVGTFVTSVPVTKQDIEKTLVLKAPLEGTESVDIASRLHYEVLRIDVKEGDRVTKGQVLAILDDSKLLDEIAVAEDNLELEKYKLKEKLAEAEKSYRLELQKLQDSLDVKQHDYETSVSDLNEVKRKVENMKVLVDKGVEAPEELKKLEAEVVSFENKVASYHVENGRVVAEASELKALETINGVSIVDGKAVADSSDNKNIEIYQRTLQQKRKDLEECTITSTIDGTVTRVYSKVGRFADGSDDQKNTQPMFVIENTDELQMKVDVSEFDIADVQVGQDVTINAEILGKDTVKGVVARISPTGEEKTNSSGGSQRVIPTQIDVIGKDTRLIAGITATANIEVAKSEGVLVVPIEAVMEKDDGTSCVYRINSESKIEIVAIETGIENDLQVEVSSSELQEGDNIIMTPDPTLTEGTVVMTAGGGAQGM